MARGLEDEKTAWQQSPAAVITPTPADSVAKDIITVEGKTRTFVVDPTRKK